jgi:hypothetical protein
MLQVAEVPQPPPLMSGWSQIVKGKATAEVAIATSPEPAQPAVSKPEKQTKKAVDSGAGGVHAPSSRTGKHIEGSRKGAADHKSSSSSKDPAAAKAEKAAKSSPSATGISSPKAVDEPSAEEKPSGDAAAAKPELPKVSCMSSPSRLTCTVDNGSADLLACDLAGSSEASEASLEQGN